MINYKKVIFTICLAIFALSGVVVPRPVNAFSDFIGGPTSVIKFAWEKVETVYDKVQSIVGAELSNRAVSQFLDTLAYDVATQLAEGGPGGKPQFRTISIEKSLQNAGNQALGEFLGELTEKGFDELGINLCDPSLELKLTLTLGLIDTERPPKPSCDWRRLQNNWSQFGDNVQADIVKFQLDPRRSGNASTVDFFRNIVSPETTDLGAAFKIDAELNRRKLEAEKVLNLSIQECAGFIDNKTPITEEVITHCGVNHDMATNLFVNATEIEAQKQLAKKQAADNKKLSDILKDAGNRFLDTFTSKLMKNWIKKGMWSLFGSSDNDIYQDYRNTLIDRLRGGSNIRQPRGADIFKDLRTVNIETIESFDYLNTFTICPDQFRQPDNCIMSPAFLQAVNNRLTIQDAVSQGIIDGDAPLIHPNDAINHTIDKCYRDNLCYANLVKLRKANMIPVGWELAALRAPVSLQQAIDCFEESETCGFDRLAEYSVDGNDHNPFYHLVDPDWVMKAPNMRCEAYAFSPVLESPDSTNRQQYCADPKVCLREDSDGNCIEDQFNYCTRSENVWDFEGNACAAGEIYSGCLTYASDDFGTNSYIEDSLEYCTADQAGCRRHSQDTDASGNWVLEDINIDTNDLFLNKQAAECNEINAGCDEYIALAPDTGANIVANGSFDDLNSDNFPDGWINDATGTLGDGVEYDGDKIANGYPWGGSAYAGTESLYQSVFLQGNTTYRISALGARYEAAINSLVRVSITLYDFDGITGSATAVRTLENVGDCISTVSPGNISIDLRMNPSGVDMEKGSCTFTTNGAEFGTSRLYIVSDSTNASWFDDIKVEVISNPNSIDNSVYSDYGDGAQIYMNDATVMCIADEVGCQGYIPRNGDPMIPAVITQDDLCPSQCVGYETFTEQPDSFDIIEGDLLVEYYNFIPNTAQECPAQEIGCEEFTNLDVVAEGGEGREYFTYLRQCVEESDGTVYYTWEGTEVAGYQIKTWYALESNLNAAPCTNMIPEGGTCLDVAFTDNNVSELNEVAACGLDTNDTSDDPENNPNCREFFDENGNVHYRFQDRVIFATDNCHDYRRTLTAQVYKAAPDESVYCQELNSGCREYYGNNSNNIRIATSDNFENGTYEPWEGNSGSVDLSNVSLNNNGHSLKAETDESFSRDVMNLYLQNDKDYKISWWMKSDTTIDNLYMFFRGSDNTNNIFETLIDPTTDSNFQNIEAGRWHYYTASVHINDLDQLNPDLIESLWLDIDTDSPVAGQGLYIDNFTIKEVENSFSVVRNSWDTPIACDQPYDGYYLGCQAYTDLNAQEFNLKSFDHLCREDAIGCMPVIDTHNSTNPFEETFNAGDASEIIVPEDNLTYLVPNPNNYCPQAAKGCLALGIPDRLDETQFSSVYKINDPDKYASIMCDSDGLNCAEYNTAKGVFYLKDPGADTCTYQQNTLIEGNLLSGWFKTATLADEIPLGCADTDGDYDTDGDGIYDVREMVLANDYCSVSDSNITQLFYFTEDDCNDAGGYWNNYLLAAQCPANENLCTSFRDPVDPVGCDPKGKDFSFIDFNGHCIDPIYTDQVSCENNSSEWVLPSKDGYCDNTDYNNEVDCNRYNGDWTPYCKDYYYYNDNNIDESSCNGLVDRHEGCVLFYETNSWNGEHSQSISIYDSQETYEDIEASNFSSSPVACDPNFDPNCNLDSNKLIKVRKDRQCAEWLACKSSTASLDKNTDSYKIICDELAACVEFQYDPDSNTTKCKKWGSHDEDTEALTFEKYQSRDTGLRNHVSWSDKEYIGYSVPNMLPVNDLLVYDFGDEDAPSSRLVYDVTDSVDSEGAYYSDCVDANRVGIDGQACSAEINTDGNYIFRGECQDRVCWLNPKVNETSTSTYAIEARAYSIADAPFPAAINQEDGLERLSKYKGANICSDNSNLCEISFKRVEYGQGQMTMYYPEEFMGGDIPRGICTSGKILDTDDKAITCDENWECDSYDSDGITSRRDGTCSTKTEEIIFRNWPGICLEYDYNNPIAQDGENSYYCNQWYPAQKIKGTASLYDNYRSAGYYEANGQDALFCAVAEPYTLKEDRVYCAKKNGLNCLVLVRVPAGARVNIDALDTYPTILEENYLINFENLWHSANETFNTDNFGGYGTTYGFDRIENTDHTSLGGSNETNSYFNLISHFEPSIVEASWYSFDVLESIFDTSVSANDMEVYIFDENVNYEGYTNEAARILSPSGFFAKWGPEYDLAATPATWRCGTQYNSTNPYSGHAIRQDTPGGDYHTINSQSVGGETAASGGVYDCEFHHGKDKVCRLIQCNPGNYNYYVKAELTVGEYTCLDYNCGNGLVPERGEECLINNLGADYNNATAMVDIAECSGDADCEFLYCASHSVAFNTHSANELTYDYINYSPENNITYCSDFGVKNTIPMPIRLDNGSTCNFNTVVNLSGCFEYLFEITPNVSIFDETEQPEDCSLFGDQNNNNITVIPGYSGPWTYNKLSIKAGISDGLLDVLFVDDATPPCLAYESGLSPNVNCSQSIAIPDFTTITYDPFSGASVPEIYPRSVASTDCDGPINDRPLSCFQQCRVVSHLDSEGSLSAVRTDIWWRSKQEDVRVRTAFPWRSWYWKPLDGYVFSDDAVVNDDEVVYSKIRAFLEEFDNYPDNFSHFGAGLGILNLDNIISTRVPYHGSFDNITAATFFGYISPSINLTDAVDNGLLEIQDLFYRVYNLEWIEADSSYQYYGERDLGGGNNTNYFAGPEYRPRVLTTCGDELCETLNADDNVIAVEEGININGVSGGTLQGLGSSLFVSTKFFYHAHPDHMPVYSVDIDWGDGPVNNFSFTPGKYKNSLPAKWCNSDSEAPGLTGLFMGFAGDDNACRPGYKIFYHDYLYDETGAHDCNGAPTGAPGTPQKPIIANASCYQPRVRVIDNWQWDQITPFNGWIVVHDG